MKWDWFQKPVRVDQINISDTNKIKKIKKNWREMSTRYRRYPSMWSRQKNDYKEKKTTTVKENIIGFKYFR